MYPAPYRNPFETRRSGWNIQPAWLSWVPILVAPLLLVGWAARPDPVADAETRQAVVTTYNQEAHDTRPVYQRPYLERQYGRLIQWRIVGCRRNILPRQWIYEIDAVRQDMKSWRYLRSHEYALTLPAGGKYTYYPANVVDVTVDRETPIPVR